MVEIIGHLIVKKFERTLGVSNRLIREFSVISLLVDFDPTTNVPVRVLIVRQETPGDRAWPAP